jgi:hypothetical protein
VLDTNKREYIFQVGVVPRPAGNSVLDTNTPAWSGRGRCTG